MKREWALKNPVALVDPPRMPRFTERRMQFLTREELDAVVRAVPGDVLGLVEGPLYLMAAMTGLRQGDWIALRWIDVDWSALRIRVADSYVRGAFDSPKNHRGGSAPMADRLAGELERRRPLRASGHGPRVGRVEAAQALLRGAGAGGCAPDHLPRLRHTFGTQMAAGGRSRSGWGMRTSRRPRSTRTTRPTRPAGWRSRRRRSEIRWGALPGEAAVLPGF